MLFHFCWNEQLTIKFLVILTEYGFLVAAKNSVESFFSLLLLKAPQTSFDMILPNYGIIVAA